MCGLIRHYTLTTCLIASRSPGHRYNHMPMTSYLKIFLRCSKCFLCIIIYLPTLLLIYLFIFITICIFQIEALRAELDAIKRIYEESVGTIEKRADSLRISLDDERATSLHLEEKNFRLKENHEKSILAAENRIRESLKATHEEAIRVVEKHRYNLSTKSLVISSS